MRVKRFWESLVVTVCLAITLLIPINSVSAISQSELLMYALNNILGYDDKNIEKSETASPESQTKPTNEDCADYVLDTGVDPGTRYVSGRNDHGHWDGSCNELNGQREQWVKSQLEHVQNVAAENGLPWEALLAQTIAESGGGQSEVCLFNPLGLKTKGGSGNPPACDSRGHASFSSYEEAWQYYVDSIQPVKRAKNKFPQDPYSYMEYLEYSGSVYAVDSEYVNKASKHICGIQKWAEKNGVPISAVNYSNFFNASSSDGDPANIENSPIKVKNNSALCSNEDVTGDAEGAEAIARMAVDMAWPTTDGTYVNSSGETVPYNSTVSTKTPKPAYQEALSKFGIGNADDCGHFVSAVLLSTGVDPNFPKSGTGVMLSYLSDSNLWSEVNNTGDHGILQPGDVLVINDGGAHHHIEIYTGSYSNYGNTASASQGTRAGMIKRRFQNSGINHVASNGTSAPYHIFRYTGGN